MCFNSITEDINRITDVFFENSYPKVDKNEYLYIFKNIKDVVIPILGDSFPIFINYYGAINGFPHITFMYSPMMIIRAEVNLDFVSDRFEFFAFCGPTKSRSEYEIYRKFDPENKEDWEEFARILQSYSTNLKYFTKYI